MNKLLVAVVDSAKARFFILEPAEFPENGSGPTLIEQEGLMNPAKESPSQELWSSTKTGRNRGAGGQAHSYDDHREQHVVEFERRFAHAIADQVVQLVAASQTRHLLLIAETQIMGLMREAIASVAPANLEVNELTKNVSHLTPYELHKYLAGQGLVPEPVRVTI